MGHSAMRRLVPVAVIAILTMAVSTSANGKAARRTVAVPAASAAVTFADWGTYHGNNQRTGNATTLRTVAKTPALVWSIPLDGAVYGSPIVVAHGITIVATENNTVYRVAGNRVIWKHHIGPPVPRTSLPCGNIDPLGITGTPAYDPATRSVLVVAELANPIRHLVVSLDPVTGGQRWFRNVDVPAAVPGIAPMAMQQRGALIVSGRNVYIPYGGLAGDCSAYRGSVIGVDLDHPTTLPLWHFSVPTSREGGIWTPPGPSENPGGGLLVAVGNGATTTTGPYDFSDSVLKLASQQIVDYFAPSSWRTDNANDLDLGSQGPAIVGPWIFTAGKSGTAYVLRRAHLGGIGAQVSSMSLCQSFGGTATSGSVVYVPCTDGLRAVRINSNGTMSVLWHEPANITGSPVIGAGHVWAMDVGAGRLHVLNQTTGADQVSLAIGTVTRFATPALYGGGVIVGTTTGVRAYNW